MLCGGRWLVKLVSRLQTQVMCQQPDQTRGDTVAVTVTAAVNMRAALLRGEWNCRHELRR